MLLLKCWIVAYIGIIGFDPKKIGFFTSMVKVINR